MILYSTVVFWPIEAEYVRLEDKPSFVQIMASRLIGVKPLSEPVLFFADWTIGNKFQWDLNNNSNPFIQENAFENVFCEMAAILYRPQCVNTLRPRQNGHRFEYITSLRTDRFPPQRASNMESVPMWWRHHGIQAPGTRPFCTGGKNSTAKNSMQNHLKWR